MIIPWPPSELLPNRSSGKHWRSVRKIRDQYRDNCYLIALSEKPDKFDQLIIEFWPPDNRRRDLDGVFSAAKNGLDGIAKAWGLDDSIFKDIRLKMMRKVIGGRVVIYTKGTE